MKQKLWGRLMSLVLCLSLCLVLLPAEALAWDSEGVEEDPADIVLYSRVWNESNKELVRITDGTNSLTVSFDNFSPSEEPTSNSMVSLPLRIKTSGSKKATYMVKIPEVPNGLATGLGNWKERKNINENKTFSLNVNGKSEIRFTLNVEVTFKGGTKKTASKTIAIKSIEPKEFTVRFYSTNPVTQVLDAKEQKVLENHYCEVPNMTLRGYSFQGWRDSSDIAVNPGTMKITKDTFFFAAWSSEHHTVDFYAKYEGNLILPEGMNNPDTTKTEHNTEYYVIPEGVYVENEGKTFVGWYQWSSKDTLLHSGDKISGITANIILYPKMENNQNVTYHANFTGIVGLPTDRDSTEGSRYEIPCTPTLEGYELTGWKVIYYGWQEYQQYHSEYGPPSIELDESLGSWVVTGIKADSNDGGIELEPIWTKSEDVAETTHKVTFDVGAADAWPVPAEQVVTDGGTVTEPETPEREDYTLQYWYAASEDTPFRFAGAEDADTITDDTVLHAKWQKNKIKINVQFDSKDGITDAGVVGDTPLDNVEKNDTVDLWFKLRPGFYFKEGAVKLDGKPMGWTFDSESNTYYFSFKADAVPVNGEETAVMIVTVGATSIKKQVITLPSGYGYKATFTGCSDPAADGKTSYEFKYGDTFQISLKADRNMTATLDVDGVTHITAADGQTVMCSGTHTVGDTPYAISAYVKEKDVWRVDYVLISNAGSYYHTAQYIMDGTAITTAPTAPAIDGYTFGGWYRDNALQTEWNFASDTVTSSTVIYGKLTGKTYTVSYDANADDSGTVSEMPSGSQSKTHGAALRLSDSAPTRTGYIFKGWATSANGSAVYQPGETYAVDSGITLYAVWEKPTFHVTVSAGTGYSAVPAGMNTVKYGEDLTIIINVDREYAAEKPTVQDITNNTPVDVTGSLTGDPQDDRAASYTYTISNVRENHNISIAATRNDSYTVSFYAVTDGSAEPTSFLTQSVEHGYYATQPSAPDREGYRFAGFFTAANADDRFDFSQAITEEQTVYAVYTAIEPVVTVAAESGSGWSLKNWKHGDADVTPAGGMFTIAYGENVVFDLEIDADCDYSQLSVSANGYALGSASVDRTDDIVTNHYYLGRVTQDTRITVSGIMRKNTYTVSYNANADDGSDVNEMPSAQSKTHGETLQLSESAPTRTGYIFNGWATSTNGPAAYQPGNTYAADAGVTLYAVWEKQTFQVTASAGTGYSVNPAGMNTVAYGDDFTITIHVDRDYAAAKPTVTDTSDVTGSLEGTPQDGGAASYTYTIRTVREDHNISINAVRNSKYTVSFYAVTDGVAESISFLTQSVEHGDCATQPAAPEREGYRFAGYFVDTAADAAKFDFSQAITEEKTVYAVYTAIEPVITVDAAGDAEKSLKNWKHGSVDAALADGKFSIAYDEDVEFDLVLDEGCDYSQLTVSANGYALNPASKTKENDIVTIHYYLSHVTQDTRITVSGIVRKTTTVKYGTLGRTASSATMYLVDVNGIEKAADLKEGTVVTYYIYKLDTALEAEYGRTYSAYNAHATAECAVPMTKADNATGVYTASYQSLPDGSYVMFAVADVEKYQSGAGQGSLKSSSSGGSGGGGGGSVSPYTVTVKDAKNGTVTADRETASSGATVTLTVSPNQGWTLETLTAINASGKAVDLNIVKVGEKYTFKMPSSNVTVNATFMEDNTILNYFVDVPTNSYYYNAVLWAVEQGITQGTDSILFSPDGICTRAQAVTFLWRAAGSPAPKSSTMPFTDVPAGSYYYDAVLWAVEQGITVGTSETTFSPNLNCTRAQIVTFLWRSEQSSAAGTVNPFADVKSDAYYADAVLWAVKKDITKGTTATTFSPDNNCTRAQIVTFLWRTLAE